MQEVTISEALLACLLIGYECGSLRLLVAVLMLVGDCGAGRRLRLLLGVLPRHGPALVCRPAPKLSLGVHGVDARRAPARLGEQRPRALLNLRPVGELGFAAPLLAGPARFRRVRLRGVRPDLGLGGCLWALGLLVGGDPVGADALLEAPGLYRTCENHHAKR
jgi:hypothetical protein